MICVHWIITKQLSIQLELNKLDSTYKTRAGIQVTTAFEFRPQQKNSRSICIFPGNKPYIFLQDWMSSIWWQICCHRLSVICGRGLRSRLRMNFTKNVSTKSLYMCNNSPVSIYIWGNMLHSYLLNWVFPNQNTNQLRRVRNNIV